MIRALILLVVIGTVLGVSYFSAKYIIQPTAKIITRSAIQSISPLDYTITTVPGSKATRVVILFEGKPKINTSCVSSVKIDNKSIDFDVSRLGDQGIEIMLHKRLVGTHKITVYACGKVINDVLIAR